MNVDPIEPGQRTALINLLKSIIGQEISRDERLWITSKLARRDLGTFNDLYKRDWWNIRNSAYLHWQEGDFETISPMFRAGINALHRHYQEKILGQERLFE